MKTGAIIAKSVENDIKLYIYSGIYAAIIAAMLVIGREMTVYRCFFTPPAKLALRFLGVWLAAFAVTALLWKLLDKINSKSKSGKKHSNPAAIYIFIFCALVPMWLINFPGTFLGDISLQLAEYEQGTISRSFPVLHTVFIGFFVTLGRAVFGSCNGGIALAVFVQLAIISGILTYTAVFFDRRSSLPHAGWLLALLYAITPALQFFSKDLVRDTLFSSSALLTGFLLYSATYEPERICKKPAKAVLFVALLTATLLLRNSAILLIAAEVIVFLIKGRKSISYKKVLALFIAALALWGVWSGLIADRATVKDSEFEGVAKSGIKESLSVPIQQVSRTTAYNWDRLTQEERDTILELFSEDTIKNYDDDCADIAKAEFNQDKFKADWKRYVKEWLELGLKYKRSYLEAFLVLNTESYYPDTCFDGNSIYGDVAYYSSGTAAPGETASLFPKIYERLSSALEQRSFEKYPLIKLLLAPATMLYLMLFAAFYARYRGGKGSVVLLPAIFIHLGTLFAPVASLRYYLASFISAAPAIMLLLSPVDNTEISEEMRP